ncbi:hypothetical protein WA158_007106 [Blastocystis sp. Blastoise]
MSLEELKEQQMMEIEAMESIYMDEFQLINKDEGEYSIKIIPDPSGENFVSVVLHVKYTEEYPNSLPEITLDDPVCLRGTDLEQIYDIIDSCGKELLGNEMIFTIAESVREFLIPINEPRSSEVSMYEQMMNKQKHDAKIQAIKEAETTVAEKQVKKRGTPVTPEVFLAWFEKFMDEMGHHFLTAEDSDKPSGRELFEKHSKELLAQERSLEEGEGVYEDEDEILKELEEQQAKEGINNDATPEYGEIYNIDSDNLPSTDDEEDEE